MFLFYVVLIFVVDIVFITNGNSPFKKRRNRKTSDDDPRTRVDVGRERIAVSFDVSPRAHVLRVSRTVRADVLFRRGRTGRGRPYLPDDETHVCLCNVCACVKCFKYL